MRAERRIDDFNQPYWLRWTTRFGSKFVRPPAWLLSATMDGPSHQANNQNGRHFGTPHLGRLTLLDQFVPHKLGRIHYGTTAYGATSCPQQEKAC